MFQHRDGRFCYLTATAVAIFRHHVEPLAVMFGVDDLTAQTAILGSAVRIGRSVAGVTDDPVIGVTVKPSTVDVTDFRSETEMGIERYGQKILRFLLRIFQFRHQRS